MDWSTLMQAPWGVFTEEAKQEKLAALRQYADEWEAWRQNRIAKGKWLTKKLYQEN
jgi:hypothetical protein